MAGHSTAMFLLNAYCFSCFRCARNNHGAGCCYKVRSPFCRSRFNRFHPSTKIGINPDNVVTPIAASLGDLTTLYLLAIIARFFHKLHSVHPMVMPVVILVFLILIPVWALIARRNEYVADVLISGWEPVIAAMVIR